jgi:hypothetical protein
MTKILFVGDVQTFRDDTVRPGPRPTGARAEYAKVERRLAALESGMDQLRTPAGGGRMEA